MKELHLEKNEKIEDIEKDEERLKLYGELTDNNIKSLNKLNIRHLDLSLNILENSTFPNLGFSNFESLTSVILPRSLKSLGNNCFFMCKNLKDVDAFNYSKELLEVEGLFVGLSSGAAFYASLLIAQKEENIDKNIVVILPDTGNRYLSLFN